MDLQSGSTGEGVTLEQRLKDGGPLAAPEAVNYISQALSALEDAQANGVMHGDIQPANMIVTPGGVLKLVNFAVARDAASQEAAQTGGPVGSPYYMSPEQIEGAANLDGRADLYSVGVSLYELVTGRRPFDGDSPSAIAAAHLEKTPVPPIALAPGLPQDLNDIILLALAKDPNARFQTAGAFRNALASVVPAAAPAPVAPVPVAAFAAAEAPRIIEPTKPAVKGSRRGLWMGIGAVAAVLAVAALIEFGPWRGSKAAPQPGAADVAPVVTPAPAAAETPLPPAAAETPLPPPAAAPAAPVAKAPASVAPRPRTATGGPPAQSAVVPMEQAPPPVQQAPPPPVQQPPAQTAARPAEGGPGRAALQAARERVVLLDARAESVRAGLQSLQRSQAATGLNLRADMRQASSLMDSYLRDASEAFKANDLAQARSLLDKAEAQIDKLETFLGH